MSAAEILEVAGALLVSTGLAGVVLLGLSGFLSKVWATRILQNEADALRKKSDAELSNLRHELELYRDQMKTTLDLYRERHLRGHLDKLRAYEMVIETVTNFLCDVPPIKDILDCNPGEAIEKFHRGHFRSYGHLALVASQPVMDAYDRLTDLLHEVINGTAKYEWETIRRHIIDFINEVRKDVEVNTSPIEYRGRL